jgi:DUF1680 family protein
VSNVVHAFIATQAGDGYLGPFPKASRLLRNWDLWGHYHALYALVLWHQHTGDPAALAAARKAADLVCHTYLDSGRSTVEAGDAEMNMAILTGMAMLHRVTGEPRYLRMARAVEKDWERAGDYLRAGLAGGEYFESPRPRWESLHDLQGLAELWRITGEAKYRAAFIHHWRSIRRRDRRNTGAFSSGEQATGNPYAPTAIETCCTVAWMALTIDYLKLTGDPRAADELELSTLNGGLGAQHASGRWWTYNTPMNGVREASAHTIVFQARAGTPELNCCSVNGPRVLGMLSEWAVMSAGDGLVVNSYLPGEFAASLAGREIRLKLDRDYPQTDSQRVTVAKSGDATWTLRLRVPQWSGRTAVQANFSGAPAHAPAGSYLEIRRRWKAGDEVCLKFDFGLRAIPGANEATGKVSLYRGPLLLAWDQASSAFDADNVPAVDLARLSEARAFIPARNRAALQPPCWLQVEVTTGRGDALRLVDFASAGSAGAHYLSWLTPTKPLAPPVSSTRPRDGERVRPAAALFQWRGPRSQSSLGYRIEIAEDEAFTRIRLATNSVASQKAVLDLASLPSAGNPERWWRVITLGPNGETTPEVPPASFTLDAHAPTQTLPLANKPGPNGELILHALLGEEAPKFGNLISTQHEAQTAQGTKLNGRDQMIVYRLASWPEEDFTIAVRVRIDEMPKARLGQVFSAWAASMDDPLRLTVENGKLYGRIEAGQAIGTAGIPIAAGGWHHVAAVKAAGTLTLFLDGQPAGSCVAPEFSHTTARDCALGGNPHFAGNEFLAATFADFGLWERALSAAEIKQLAAH